MNDAFLALKGDSHPEKVFDVTLPLARWLTATVKMTGAVPTDILHFACELSSRRLEAPEPPRGVERRAEENQPSCPSGHSAVLRLRRRHVGSDAPPVPHELSVVMKTTDDCVHAAHGPLAKALRPPPSESRPPQRRRHHRHAPRRPSLNGSRLAGHGPDSRRVFGWWGPHGPRAATGSPKSINGSSSTRLDSSATVRRLVAFYVD